MRSNQHNTQQLTQFTLTADNPFIQENEITSRRIAIAQLSTEDLIAVRNKAHNRRIHMENQIDSLYEFGRKRLRDKFIK